MNSGLCGVALWERRRWDAWTRSGSVDAAGTGRSRQAEPGISAAARTDAQTQTRWVAGVLRGFYI